MKDIITIGRDYRCDVRIDQSWDTVSNEHADIKYQGGTLVFYDHSSNGTLINGQKVHNRNVEIYPGDEIRLAGVFELEWNVINRYFPNLHRPTVTRNIRGEEPFTGRRTIPYQNREQQGYSANSGRITGPFRVNPPKREEVPVREYEHKENYGVANAYSQADIDKAIEKWNWGAFFCTWLWGLFHKTYWPLLVIILNFIPYIGQVASLCLAVYLGMNGSKIAWNKGVYKDFESFKHAQRNWTIGGCVWFVVGLLSSFFILFVTLS